jgi:signal transduction histidine kinase
MAGLLQIDGRLARWRRALLTSGPLPPGGSRSARDWLTDWALFAFAAGVGCIGLAGLWHTHGVVLDWIDVAAGVLACLALWARRTSLPAVLVALAASAFSPLALGAGLVAICAAASRLTGRALIALAVVVTAGSFVFLAINPAAGEILKVAVPAFLFAVMAFGWGLYLRARRELVVSLRERADRLEADRQRSAEQAREAERRRIAREMHDVLAHRLSLLSVHAGALEFHPGAPPGEIAKAATVIRTSAAAALGELRQVITVLREDSDGAVPPQPGFGQLAELLEDSRSAGMTLHARIDVPDTGLLPAALGRTVYRVVQEGLTNARKHAPGAPVTVTVTVDGQAVVAEVISRRALVATGQPSATAAPAGAGAGLIGIAERVALADGRLEHGPNVMGDFVLRATIPRPP